MCVYWHGDYRMDFIKFFPESGILMCVMQGGHEEKFSRDGLCKSDSAAPPPPHVDKHQLIFLWWWHVLSFFFIIRSDDQLNPVLIGTKINRYNTPQHYISMCGIFVKIRRSKITLDHLADHQVSCYLTFICFIFSFLMAVFSRSTCMRIVMKEREKKRQSLVKKCLQYAWSITTTE